MFQAHRNRSAARRRQQAARRHRQRFFRLSFERLEERCLLATIVWDGGPTGSGRAWNNAANWFDQTNMVNDVQPSSNDDVQIGAAFAGITITHATSSTTIRSLASEAKLDILGGSVAIVFVSGAPVSRINDTLTISGGTFSLENTTLNGPGLMTNAASITIRNSTINAGLTNQGFIEVRGPNNAFNGAFSNTASATLAIGSVANVNEDAALTVANGFTNAGLLQFEAASSNGSQPHSATLNVTSGSLVNTGSITSSGDNFPFANQLNAELDNQGTLTVGARPLTINKPDAHHLNSGTITVTGNDLTMTQSGAGASFMNANSIIIASGRTFTIGGGTFDFQAGTLDNVGPFIVNNSTFNLTPNFTLLTGRSISLSGTTITGVGTLTNQGTLTVSNSNVGVGLMNASGGQIAIRQRSSFTGSFSNALGATLAVGSAANVNEDVSLTVASGFTNAGSLRFEAASSNGSQFHFATLNVTSGTLVNTGSITSSGDNFPFANQLNAELDNQGTLTVGARPLTINTAGSHHRNSGTISVRGADLTLSQSGTSPSFASTGAIDIAPGRTLTINGGEFHYDAGTIDSAGPLVVNNSKVTFTPDFTLPSGRSFTLNNSTLNGPGQLTNQGSLTVFGSTVGVNLTNQSDGLIQVTSTSDFTGSFVNASKALVQVIANAFVAGANTLTVTSGFTNAGTIHLLGVGSHGSVVAFAKLAVPGGTLLNTGTIYCGGDNVRLSNILTAELDNRGTLAIDTRPLIIDKLGAQHFNSGTISVASGQTLNISNGTFASLNAGTLASGTYLISGTFQFPNAAITTNASKIVLDGPTARIVNQFEGNAFNSFANNLAGASLTMRNGVSISALASVTNAGDLTLGMSSTLSIAGDYTQQPMGNFNVEIGGDPASLQFGRLIASGQAHLDGEIHVALVNGFGPRFGQTFPVLSSFGQTGNFAKKTGLNIGHVQVFEILTNPDTVTIRAIGDAGDLAADANSISFPANGTSGDIVQVTYKVSNTTTTPVPGDWLDSLYLSSDDTLDAEDTLIGRVAHTGGLDGLANYLTTATFALPGTVEGDYRVIVVTDSRGLAPDRTRNNNTAISNSVIRTQLPVLTLGQTSSVSLDGGVQKLFRLDVPPGKDVQLGVNFSQFGVNRPSGVFVLFGQIPTAGKFAQSASSGLGLHQELLLLGHAGPHYVLVVNSDVPGNAMTIDLTPVPLDFSLQTVSLDHGSNRGQVTVKVTGTNFSPDNGVVLQNAAGAVRAAQRVLFKDANTLFVTFDLAGLTSGGYDLKVTRGAAATNALTFTVTPGGNPGHVTFTVSSPDKIRAGATATVTVDYRNDGDTDVPALLVLLKAEAAVLPPFRISKVTYSSSGGGGGGGGANSGGLFPGPLRVHDISGAAVKLQFLANSPDGLGGVLSPGAHGHVEMEFHGSNQPSPPDLFFTALIDERPETKTPNFVKDDLRPPTVSPEAWDVLFAKFFARVGTTDLGYQTALDDAATYMSQIGQSTSNVAQLTAFLVEQVDNAYPGGALAASVDGVAPAAGLPLVLARVYSQPISRRYEIGAFGRGWLHSYEMTLTHIGNDPLTKDDDLVIIHGPSGDRAFKKNPPDPRFPDLVIFGGQFGDTGKIETVIGGFRILTDPDGTEYIFSDETGRLLGIKDLNGNRVTLIYTGGLLTSFVHSNGDRFTLAHNVQGRISQVTDQAGRVTAYGYDAAGEHLLQVSGPEGTLGYTYNTSHGTGEHALTSVINRDGSHVLYSYDSEGRLIHSERDGGTEAVTVAYGAQATVAFTDAAGATGTVLFDPFGHAAQVRDALGQIVTRSYDSNFHLDRERLPGNLTVDTDFGENGYLERRVDPSGHEVRTSLVHVTNELGVSTDFNYDGRGNLTSIKYPQGPSPQFSHDAAGNLSGFTNRRGQVIQYTHNARGQLTRKSHADGSHEDYAYDNRGNLLTASDEHGTTTFQYDSGDRLTKVTYSNGRFLRYTRDTGGRVTRRETQDGFIVNFVYDTAGRLANVKDAVGAVLASYAFDAVGRLMSQDHANGTFTTYDYDAAGQVTHLVNHAPDGGVNSRFDYAYDNLGRRTQMTTLDGIWTFEYDVLGQLTHAVFASTNAGIPNQNLQYEYDPAGNRIRTTQNGIVTPYTTNKLDQYTLVGTSSHSYDADGHQVAVGSSVSGTSDTFDDEGRLIGVTTPAGVWSYEYDALGCRVASVHNGQRTEYLIDPTGQVDVVGEYSGAGNALAHYAYGLGLAGRVGADGTADFYDFDGTGSTAGLTGAGGKYVNTYSYLPFGESLTTPQETVANPFSYVGQFGVMQEGNGLDFMRARYYSPTDGRFISADPIGAAGGINLYRYVGNQPTNIVDPAGLNPFFISTFLTTITDVSTAIESTAFDTFAFETTVTAATESMAIVVGDAAVATATESGAVVITETAAIATETASGLGGFVAVDLLVVPFALAAAGIAGYALGDELVNQYPGLGSYFGDLVCDALDCDQPDPVGGSKTVQVRSLDPNDISGPGGFGDKGFLTSDFAMPYTIHFENVASANAPAQTVVVKQQLDVDLDFRTFELGNISFGDFEFAVEPGLQSFSARFDVRDRLGIFLDITADFNPLSGLATWTFTSVDPKTFDLPVDPDLGFLPPNKVSPTGEGFVSYTIRAKAGALTGTRFDAQGRIVFDTNAPLDTPRIFNTIDSGAPTSSVAPLPPITPPGNFRVNWSGVDDTGGSGIATFDIYVSIDTAQPVLWMNRVTTLQADFTGEPGKSYAFYSIATDAVGHQEVAPTTADATTIVIIPWQNISNRFDVDDSGDVSPLDALVVINDLNLNGSRKLPASQNPLDPRKYIDVDGDGFATPLDVLSIINFLNQRGNAEGESSQSQSEVTMMAPEATDILLADLSWLDGLDKKRTRSKRNLK